MAELADAPDLGSGGRPCRFKSCYPHLSYVTLRVCSRRVIFVSIYAGLNNIFEFFLCSIERQITKLLAQISISVIILSKGKGA